jgi:putative transposase
LEALIDDAFEKHPALNGLIFHSDRGWQYQHQAYQAALANRGIDQSMSRLGNSLDDGLMEGFFGILKREMFYGQEHKYEDLNELEQAIHKLLISHKLLLKVLYYLIYQPFRGFR